MAMCVSDVKRALDKDRQGRKQLQAELRAATRAYKGVLPDRQAEDRAQALQVTRMSDWPHFLASTSSASPGHVIMHVTRKQTGGVCIVSAVASLPHRRQLCTTPLFAACRTSVPRCTPCWSSSGPRRQPTWGAPPTSSKPRGRATASPWSTPPGNSSRSALNCSAGCKLRLMKSHS